MTYQTIADQGWLPEDRIIHYGLHKELDIEHSEEFLQVVNDDWTDVNHRPLIKEGVKFGCHLLANAYVGFYNNIAN